MSYFDSQMKHFEEIDEYMAERVRTAGAARRDRNGAELAKVVAEVRGDGYPRFADALADIETLDFPNR